MSHYNDRLTTVEYETLEYIKEFFKKEGHSPTQRDIATHFGIAQPPAQARLERLERKGFIRRKAGLARSISVIKGSR